MNHFTEHNPDRGEFLCPLFSIHTYSVGSMYLQVIVVVHMPNDPHPFLSLLMASVKVFHRSNRVYTHFLCDYRMVSLAADYSRQEWR